MTRKRSDADYYVRARDDETSKDPTRRTRVPWLR